MTFVNQSKSSSSFSNESKASSSFTNESKSGIKALKDFTIEELKDDTFNDDAGLDTKAVDYKDATFNDTKLENPWTNTPKSA